MSPLRHLDSSSTLPSVAPDSRHDKSRSGRSPSPRCSSAISAAPLPSHNIKPGRRRYPGVRRCSAPLRSSTWLLLILGMLGILCGISEAGIIEKSRYIESRGHLEPGPGEELLVDIRPPPIAPVELNLWRRQNSGDPFGSPVSGPSSTAVVESSTSVVASFTTASSPASTTASPPSSATTVPPASSSLMTAAPATTTLPKPFDTNLSSNFTSSSCPDFFSSFLNNATFRKCLPLSLLLQNSNSFFLAEKSVTLITYTLDATCSVPFSICSTLMGSLATQLRSNSNCGYDYADQNALVMQAYNGLVAYSPVYQAGCLQDAQGNYCFANAITNTTSPSDSYVYFLPLGIALPGASRPTCSRCLQNTMNIFAGAASNLSQPVSSTYLAAAVQIDQGCGPSFANSTVTPIQGSEQSVAGKAVELSSLASLIVAIVALVVWS